MHEYKEFQSWIEEMEDKRKYDLVELVKQECRSFVSVLVASLRSRM